MNAVQFVKLIKEMPNLKDTPVVIYSRSIVEGERESVLRAGALDFLVGVSDIQLLKKVNEALK